MKFDRAPKTVGELRKILAELPDETPIMKGRGNWTFESFNKYAGVSVRDLRRIGAGSTVFVDERSADRMKIKRTKQQQVVTFG